MLDFDTVGEWSKIKLEILRKYAVAYSTILAKQSGLDHYYIDGFSGAGLHVSRETGEPIEGSPRIALSIDPPFKHHYFIDLDGDRLEFLQQSVGSRKDVEILKGDCNEVLLREVFPRVRYEQYRRALCLLDPYGLHLNWEVIRSAGEMKTIDLFLNFPVMDMNRNALWTEPSGVSEEDRARMTRFWGDETWFDASYERSRQLGLFGDEEAWIKGSNAQVAEAFRQRLRQVARFGHVPPPLPMRNSKKAIVYYLFFASANGVAANIVDEIFDAYR